MRWPSCSASPGPPISAGCAPTLKRSFPPWVPNPKRAVWVTGLLEILGAIGLLLPEMRQLAGICLIAFLIAVFPANIHAAQTGVKLGERPVSPLWVRGPMQALLILLLAWTITAPY